MVLLRPHHLNLSAPSWRLFRPQLSASQARGIHNPQQSLSSPQGSSLHVLARDQNPEPFQPAWCCFLPTPAMSTVQRRGTAGKTAQKPSGEKQRTSVRPSACILLVSPTNQVLLLHRVQTSSSFPSAHVFPGGNLSTFHDGSVPPLDTPEAHCDSIAYRLAAVRETFEESGILLARTANGRSFLRVPDQVREAGRKEVHANKVRFEDWLRSVGGVPDLENLVPFTRWITPLSMPKRFSTQMYLYLLPVSQSVSNETIVPTPTHDGGLEHTAATFDDATTWISKARAGDILLYAPQCYLLTLLSQFFQGPAPPDTDASSWYQAQRDKLISFIQTVPTSQKRSHPTAQIPWVDKVMSPTSLFEWKSDSRVVLALDKPGPELANTGRGGDWDRVVLVRFTKGGSTSVKVSSRDDVLREQREAESVSNSEPAGSEDISKL